MSFQTFYDPEKLCKLRSGNISSFLSPLGDGRNSQSDRKNFHLVNTLLLIEFSCTPSSTAKLGFFESTSADSFR